MPHGVRLSYEMYAALARVLEEKGDTSNEAECRKFMVALIDAEIARLTRLAKALEAVQQQRAQYKTSAAVIPAQELSDRLVRYEAHLSREIDRTLSQLERLQRMRRGQPVLPPVKVDLSL
jgi:hypothetical protein